MIRVRFYMPISVGDYRPISWPIPHPFWCSGESEDAFIIVAYADNTDQILQLWPEAYDLDVMDEDAAEYTFTSRFPKPNWME